ncbi:hypothetical protein [Macrococcus capreoli]|uniref:hypothetical protein n=1 Tax=Macrococcus capreoli TaxID=2982690 RepID=UPI003EE6BBA0
MIHLTNEEYDNLMRQIDEKTESIALYAKEKNEQKQRADTLQHAIMQIRNDLVMENEERNSSAIKRLNTLLGVIEDD